MKAKEIYEKETGNKQPTNQIAYHEWYIEYVKWLEKEFVTMYNYFFSLKHRLEEEHEKTKKEN